MLHPACRVKGRCRYVPLRSSNISYLHDIGAPKESLHLIFEKIAAGAGVAIRFKVPHK
jgi:hypothetical protein